MRSKAHVLIGFLGDFACPFSKGEELRAKASLKYIYGPQNTWAVIMAGDEVYELQNLAHEIQSTCSDWIFG